MQDLIGLCAPFILDLVHLTTIPLLAINQPEWENGGPSVGYYQVPGTVRCIYADAYRYHVGKKGLREAIHFIEIRVRDGEKFEFAVPRRLVKPEVLERIDER